MMDDKIDGWMDGRMNGWMDGRIDGWMDGWMNVKNIIDMTVLMSLLTLNIDVIL